MENEENRGLNMDDLTGSSTSYLNEINKIKKSIQATDTKIELLNILFKDFLRKKYHIKKNAEYSELIDYFLEKKKPHIATFCHEMVEALYSGDEIDDPKVMLILDDARLTIEKEMNVKVNEADDESTLQTFMKPLMGKDSKNSLSDDKNVSKQTKKIIDRYMVTEENTPMKSEEDADSNAKKEQADEIEVLKSRLSLSKQKDGSTIDEIDSTGKIEGIDDLERIKEKIRIKKIYSEKK